MSKLLKVLNPAVTQYKDRRFEGSEGDWDHAITTSACVYIGNLAFYTREEQIYDIFARVGHIRRVIMGLDKVQKTPCGFAFVSYYTREDAEACVAFLNGTLLDDRPIRVDIDWGFVEGRQYGRGRSGGQVRDEYRQDYDPGRGGFGKIVQRDVMQQLGYGQDVPQGQFRGGRPEGRGDFKRQRTDAAGAHVQGGAGAGAAAAAAAGGEEEEEAPLEEAGVQEGEGERADVMQEGDGDMGGVGGVVEEEAAYGGEGAEGEGGYQQQPGGEEEEEEGAGAAPDDDE